MAPAALGCSGNTKKTPAQPAWARGDWRAWLGSDCWCSRTGPASVPARREQVRTRSTARPVHFCQDCMRASRHVGFNVANDRKHRRAVLTLRCGQTQACVPLRVRVLRLLLRIGSSSRAVPRLSGRVSLGWRVQGGRGRGAGGCRGPGGPPLACAVGRRWKRGRVYGAYERCVSPRRHASPRARPTDADTQIRCSRRYARGPIRHSQPPLAHAWGLPRSHAPSSRPAGRVERSGTQVSMQRGLACCG